MMENKMLSQKALMIGAIAIGIVGILSGIWQASVGNPTSIAGLIGGAITLAIGCYGLYKIRLYGND